MSQTRVSDPNPPVFGVVTRMPKRQRSRLHARTTVKLDTVMGIAREMGRLIRLSYNGHLPVNELTGYVYALDKTRAALESAIAIEAHAAAAEAEATAKAHPLSINIIAVPPRVSQQDGSFAPSTWQQLEHRTPEVTATPIEQEFEPQTERERRLLAELEALSPEQLLERAKQAGFVDADSI